MSYRHRPCTRAARRHVVVGCGHYVLTGQTIVMVDGCWRCALVHPDGDNGRHSPACLTGVTLCSDTASSEDVTGQATGPGGRSSREQPGRAGNPGHSSRPGGSRERRETYAPLPKGPGRRIRRPAQLSHQGRDRRGGPTRESQPLPEPGRRQAATPRQVAGGTWHQDGAAPRAMLPPRRPRGLRSPGPPATRARMESRG
jgi:hypothetical protein